MMITNIIKSLNKINKYIKTAIIKNLKYYEKIRLRRLYLRNFLIEISDIISGTRSNK